MNSEDCNISKKFDIEFGRLEYFPENETAVLEINATENVTSKHLKNISFTVAGGNKTGDIHPKIQVGNNTSENGVLVRSEQSALEEFLGQRESTGVTQFPLEPVKIIIYGGSGDEDEDSYAGLEQDEVVNLHYYQQYVSIEGYCRPNTAYSIFKLKKDSPEIKWKTWKPHTEWQKNH